MQMLMENSGVTNEKLAVSANGFLLPSSSFKGSDDLGGDSAFYEKFILDDLDSYWDDLNVRLTVSRMVSDSVIKGMVNAVVEEAADNIALKDSEIAILNERLESNQFDASKIDKLESFITMPKRSVTKLDMLRSSDVNNESIAVEELQWEHAIQGEVITIVTRDSIRGLHDKFETKLYEQRRLINTLSTNWQMSIDELSNMREELDAISRSFGSEPGLLLSYNSIDSFEERNSAKVKDLFPRKPFRNQHIQPEEYDTSLMEKSMDSPKPMLDDADSPKLKHMTKEEVIVYYRTEMLKMSRHHEHALQEKTEELFKLKREFLREKGSSYIRKDKEFDFCRKKIPEVISKLDNILSIKKNLPTDDGEHEELCNLRNIMDTLLFENQQLRGLLTDRRKEVKSLAAQVSDASTQISIHSSKEASLLERIRKLKWDVEDSKIEAEIRGDVYSTLLNELIGKKECGMEDIRIKIQIMQDIHLLIFKGVIHDAMSSVNPIESKYYVENASLEATISEKEKALCLAWEENKKLKEAGLHMVQQQECFDLVNRELIMLKDQIREQEALLADRDRELVSLQSRQVSLESRLGETLQQIHHHELEIDELNQKLRITSESVTEAEKERTILSGIVEEKQKAFSSFITKNKEKANQLKGSVTALIEDLENRLLGTIQRNESRLKVLNHQCMLLTEQASLIWKRGLWYKQILEIKSSNLEMAEAEVDLLGDEVDALMSLLGKIYIALDHYSPIFELYPGVMDILKLVQRKLKGETVILV